MHVALFTVSVCYYMSCATDKIMSIKGKPNFANSEFEDSYNKTKFRNTFKKL